MKTGNKTRAAVFTLVSLIILGVLYSMAMNVVLSAGPSYELEFDHAGTINRGTMVSKLGIKVGSVSSLRINPETRSSVIVTIRLDRDIYLREADRFAILTRGMFGDQSVEIYPGPEGSPRAAEGTRFQGEPTVDLASIMADSGRVVRNIGETSELVNELLRRNVEMIDQVVANVERFTGDLGEISGGTREMIAALDKLEAELTEGVPEIIANVRSASGRANDLLSHLHGIADEGGIGDTLSTIQQAAQEIAQLGSRLGDEGSTLSRLQSGDTAEQIEGIIANLAELSDNLRVASEGIRMVFEEMDEN